MAALCLGASWALVNLPPFAVVVALLAGLGLCLWLVSPAVAVDVWVILTPFTLTYEAALAQSLRVHDAVLMALIISTGAGALAGSPRLRRFSAPVAKSFMLLWVFLVVWGSITFLWGPANQWFLKGPVWNTWYLYRGVWRDLLPFPLLVFTLGDRRSCLRVLDLFVLASMVAAIEAIWEAWRTGLDATGPFDTKNQLAGFMILSIPFVSARLLLATSWRQRLIAALFAPVLLRALWLAGSRGGLVACLSSLLALALLVPRKRLIALGIGAVVASGMILVVNTDLLDRPMVQRFLTLEKGSEDENYQWRQEQWRLFLDRLAERPWLGTGSDVVPAMFNLGRAPTAHNGYLGLAIRSGIPETAAYVLLLGLLGTLSINFALVAIQPDERALWIGAVGSLVALVVHNWVETTILMPQVQAFIWILATVTLLMALPRSSESNPGGALDA